MKVSLFGAEFDLRAPYEAGAPLGEAEAKTLNQVRKENISNNVRKKIKALMGEAKELAGDALTKAAALIAEADANYVFTLASVGGARRVTDPVEREAISIAKAAIAAKLTAAGRKLKDVDKDKLAAAVAKAAAEPQIVALAKKRVKEREAMAGVALDDL